MSADSLGCEICKPAVGSILASLHNRHVMDADMHALQDTNDRYLGNIQRNGTFSVVPRVAAGEILPEHLIVIGQVAKEYGLYTKIVRRPWPPIRAEQADRRPASRHVRSSACRCRRIVTTSSRSLRRPAGDLEASQRRRNGVGSRVRQVAADRQGALRVDSSSAETDSPASAPPGVATASATRLVSPCSSRTATRACARRTSSSARRAAQPSSDAGTEAACPAACASAPRRRARTLASSRPTRCADRRPRCD